MASVSHDLFGFEHFACKKWSSHGRVGCAFLATRAQWEAEHTTLIGLIIYAVDSGCIGRLLIVIRWVVLPYGWFSCFALLTSMVRISLIKSWRAVSYGRATALRGRILQILILMRSRLFRFLEDKRYVVLVLVYLVVQEALLHCAIFFWTFNGWDQA